MSRKFPLTKLVGYPKTSHSFSIIENKRLWDILILSLQFAMPEDENWKISIKGTSPLSIPLLSPIIFQMFNVWSNVAIFTTYQWPYSYNNFWANVYYIYLFGIIHGISMEHFFGIQYEDTTKPTTKRCCQSDSGSAQVGFDRPLIPVLIDSLRNKRPKTSNHELHASLGPIVWWRVQSIEKKGPKRPSSGKNFPVDKNLTTFLQWKFQAFPGEKWRVVSFGWMHVDAVSWPPGVVLVFF